MPIRGAKKHIDVKYYHTCCNRVTGNLFCRPCWPPPTTLCFSTGRESRWSPLRAGHQAAQQSICFQCLLQRAALCAGLAAERGLPSAGFQELSAEWWLGQWGRGRVPWASREAAKGMSRYSLGCLCSGSSMHYQGESQPLFFTLGMQQTFIYCDNWSYFNRDLKPPPSWQDYSSVLCFPTSLSFSVSLPVFLYYSMLGLLVVFEI